jgi:hypothetical protein
MSALLTGRNTAIYTFPQFDRQRQTPVCKSARLTWEKKSAQRTAPLRLQT